MDVSDSHTYDAPVGVVIAMFADADAVAERFRGMGHRNIDVTRCELDGDSLTVESSRDVDVELPGFAKKVLSPTNRMIQTDRWRRDGEGWQGSFTVEVAGAPLEMHGTMSLSPDGEQTVHDVKVVMRVKVPLVGGRIADWVGRNEVPSTMQAEFRAGDQWLAANT